MTKRSIDLERMARAFPSPEGSRPARSLTYQWSGQIHRAVIGRQRSRWDAAGGTTASEGSGRGSGNTVISIQATGAAIEIWSKEPTLGWPNPSLVAHDSVLDIEYLDADAVAT